MPLSLSLLDYCTIYEGETATDAYRRSVRVAQTAEKLGFQRIWYTEHHNMAHVASSAPAVLIAHVAAHTSTIRLGAGGVMLPNHAPYVIAEQFGTLAHLYPDRIDLGLGRAPGTDPNTLGRALRRPPQASERFSQDVGELQGFLSTTSPIPGVTAVPGAGTRVPLYILGSSLSGAHLAAKMGLPFAFASHFAPTHLLEAGKVYREEFRPSDVLSEPYFIAGVNVIAAKNEESARSEWEKVAFNRVKAFAGRGQDLSDTQVDKILKSSHGKQIIHMLKYLAVGNSAQVKRYLKDFSHNSKANELMVSLLSSSERNIVANMGYLASAFTAEFS